MSPKMDDAAAAARKKKGRGWKILLCVLAGLAVFFAVINLIPPKKVMENNPFIKAKGELPMIAAHRGGGISNPENTLLAFRTAVKEYGIRICETDLWMTSDGHLVYSHDSSINRVACPDGAEKVTIGEHTLEELRRYNMGYNFRDPVSGEYIYRDADEAQQEALGLKIPEFQDLLAEFYETNKDLLFIVEIKNDGETGFQAAGIIDRVLTEQFPDYRSNLVVGTFHPAIEADLKENHPTLLRGASTAGAAKFILTQLLRVNLFSGSDFSCLQIPMEYDLKGIRLKLTAGTIIERAHRQNIAVQFWTINDADDMRFLIERDVDAIMTDDPLLLKKVLDEYR